MKAESFGVIEAGEDKDPVDLIMASHLQRVTRRRTVSSWFSFLVKTGGGDIKKQEARIAPREIRVRDEAGLG